MPDPTAPAPADTDYDLIVIGGGALGLATAWYAALHRQARVLVLEQSSFGNQLGSSAGETRQWRVQYSEAFMSELALTAAPYWTELQRSAATPLIDHVGCVWFGDPDEDTTEGQIVATMATMDKLKIPYTPLTAAQLAAQYNFVNLPANYVGFNQPDGGCIDVAATFAALWRVASASPQITLREFEPALHLSSAADGITVATAAATYTGAKLVVAAGPYTNDVLRLLGFTIPFDIWQMPSAYFRKTNPAASYPTWFAFQAPSGPNQNLFYGFPEAGYAHPGYIRVAPDFPQKILSDPAQRDPQPGAAELARTADFVARHMVGLDPTPVFTSSCLVGLLRSKEDLVLGFAPAPVPNHQNIVIQATGWCFKFVPLMGRLLTELALDGRTICDISNFPTPSPIVTR